MGYTNKALAVWGEVGTICFEFVQGYEENPPWYASFQTAVRRELGARDPSSQKGWIKGGGKNGNAWKLSLQSPTLWEAVSIDEAKQAVERAACSMAQYPWEVNIKIEWW